MPQLGRSFCRALLIALVAASNHPLIGAEVAGDQRQVAIGYERLETLALRIADAVEATDEARATQIRTAISEARTKGLTERFDQVVLLLEGERYQAARSEQTELATQLEELLRLVMADPNESRLEEERQRLEFLRRELRTALREQRSLRALSDRGEGAETAPRQEELAERIERLQEPAQEADRAAGRTEKPSNEQPEADQPTEAGQSEKSEPNDRSIAGRLQKGGKSMRQASEQLAEQQKQDEAKQAQREAQRELEAAQREAEERLRQLREEEQQRRLASLAERFRRMHEAQTKLVDDTEKRLDAIRDDAKLADNRATRLAAAQLSQRQAEVGSAAELALRLVRADGSSLVFDDALAQIIVDIRTAEQRLRRVRLDSTTIAIEQSVVEALSEMIAAVDESLDELEQKKASSKQGGPQQAGGPQGLVSKIAELKMIRSIQSRLMRQTKVWRTAAEAAEATPEEVTEQMIRLAREQRQLAASAEAVAKEAP